VSAMKPGLAKIFEKLSISWYFHCPEISFQRAENGCCIDYANAWLSKRVHSLSERHSPHHHTSDYGSEDALEFYPGVARARLPIMECHTQVAPKSKIQWLPATLHNSRAMDDSALCHGCIEAVPKLDPVDVEEAYSPIWSCHRSVK
jgi:hypothetical protein